MGSGRDRPFAIVVGQVVMVTMERALRHTETRGEFVQFVEAGVAHQVAPASFTEPPVRTVDVQSQRRRSGRTRTGIGFGRAPSTRAPTPIPTAVATMVTIQEATISTYSPAHCVAWRTRKCCDDGGGSRFSVRSRIPNHIRHPTGGREPTGPERRLRPRRTPTEAERRSDDRRGTSPDRWPPTSNDVRRR